MKRLRPFVNFNYDLRKNLDIELSASQKNEITRYYNQVSSTYGQSTVIYRPKKSANISAAKKASGLSGSKFKAYPIASPTGAGRVKVGKDGISIETPGGTVKTIILDMRKLVTGPRDYLEPLLKDGPWYIVNSKYDWNASGKKKQVIATLEAVIERYGWGMEAEEDDGEDRKRVFPIYLLEVNIKALGDFQAYRRARDEAQKARTKRGKRNARKANKKGR